MLGPLLLARDVDASLTTSSSSPSMQEGEERQSGLQELPFLVEEGLGEEKQTGVNEQNKDTMMSIIQDTTAAATSISPTVPTSPSSLKNTPISTVPSPPPPPVPSFYHREPVPITDPSLLALALVHQVTVDSNGEFDLTYREMLTHPSIWLLTLFFTTILTPGWGIKVD